MQYAFFRHLSIIISLCIKLNQIMSSLKHCKSKQIYNNNLVQLPRMLPYSVAFDQQNSGQFYVMAQCGRKIANKVKINNGQSKLVRPNRTTQNLKSRKQKNIKRDNKQPSKACCSSKLKNNQRVTNRSSSNSNTSWQKSLRSDKTQKKSSNRSSSFKLLGLNRMGSGQLSNSNSNSLSIIKSTSRNKQKSPTVSLKSKMEKQTLKKSHKLSLKSTQKQKQKQKQKTNIKQSQEKYQVNAFQIDQQIHRKRKENNKNPTKIKHQIIEKARKKQEIQKIEAKRNYNLKSSGFASKSVNKGKKRHQSDLIQDSNSSYLLSPIYRQPNMQVIKNQKRASRSRQKENKKTKLQSLMKIQNEKQFDRSTNSKKQIYVQYAAKIKQEKHRDGRQLLKELRKSQHCSLFDKYMRGYATSRDYYWLVSAATKIQKVWRGYRDRKYFYRSLQQATSPYQSIHKGNFQANNRQFWFNDSSNSIIQIQKQFEDEEIVQHRIQKVDWVNSLRIQQKNKQPHHAGQRQLINQSQIKQQQSEGKCPKQLQSLMKKLHNKFTKPKFVEILFNNQQEDIHLESKNQSKIIDNQMDNKDVKTNTKAQQKLQIIELEKRIQAGQQKYKNLEQQFSRMKLLIMKPKGDQKQKPKPHTPSNQDGSMQSHPLQFDEYEITSSRVSSQFNQNNSNSQSDFKTPRQSRLSQSPSQNRVPSEITENGHINTIKISNCQESDAYTQRSSQEFSQFKNRIQQFRKNIEQSVNSQSFEEVLRHSMKPEQVFHSPRQEVQKERSNTNKLQEQQQIMLSQDRLSHLFIRKQIKVDQLYEKKASMFQNLLNQNILSPKTYQNKIFILKENCSKEKSEIQNKLKQAQNVINYLKDIQKQLFPQRLNVNISQAYKVDKKTASISPIKNVDCYYGSPSPIKQFQKFSQLQSSSSFEGSRSQVAKHEKKSATKFISVQETKNTSIKRQGFDTSIPFIKIFCIQLSNFVRVHQKNNTWQKIHMPIDQNSFLMLQAYRTNQELEHVSQYNIYSNEMLYPFFKYVVDRENIIEKQTFDKFLLSFQRKIENQKIEQRQFAYDLQSDNKILKLYFYELLFDAFNEAMQYERPYGVKGKGFAWNKRISRLIKCSNFNYQRNSQAEAQMKMNEFFGNSIGRMMHWVQFLCGFFPQFPEDSSFSVTYDDNSKKQMRQKRMALMLQSSIIESQQAMNDIEPQITETQLFLSQQIFDGLIEEFTNQKLFLFANQCEFL